MSDKKRIKLPTGISKSLELSAKPPASDSLPIEILKTQRSDIDANAKIEVAKLQVTKEAISLVKSVFAVLKSNHERQSTVAEWKGRVKVAEEGVKEAEVCLLTARETNKPRLEGLKQSREVQSRLLLLFDEIMKDLTEGSYSDEVKAKAREDLLELSDKIVELKK